MGSGDALDGEWGLGVFQHNGPSQRGRPGEAASFGGDHGPQSLMVTESGPILLRTIQVR